MKIKIIHLMWLAARLAAIAAFAAAGTTLTLAGGTPLDFNFSTDGKALIGFGNGANPASDTANAVAVQPDGKLVVVGGTTVSGSWDFALVRLNVDGSLDPTFGAGGRIRQYFSSGIDVAQAVAVLPDGHIIVVGYFEHTESPGKYGLVYELLDTDGSELESTFWDVITNGSTLGTSVALGPDGAVVVGGYVTHGATNFDWMLIRMTALPDRLHTDQNFGNNGVVLTDFNGGNDTLADLNILSNGWIIAAGTATVPGRSGQDFAVARYRTDGHLDPFFGVLGYGKMTTNFGAGSNDRVLGMMHTNATDKIVVVGDSTIFGGSIAMAQYNWDGTLDTGFDGDGKVITNLNPNSTETATSIAWEPDGKLLVGGHVDSTVLPTSFTLVRYNRDGSLDDTFGTGGRVNTMFGTGNASAESVVMTNVQGNRRIIAAGSLNTSSGYDMAVAAYGYPGQAARSDFSGDGWADFSVFRPSDNVWYISDGANGAVSTITHGASGDIPVPGDYDRDLITDAAVYRPSTHTFLVRKSVNQQTYTTVIGAAGDIPVQGDYDGDCQTDVAVYTPTTSVWTIQRTALGLTTATHGMSGDKPVQGDYDGDGKTDLAVFRPSNGTWYLRRSTFGSTSVQFGLNGDIPVPADYDGDGRTDIAVFRPSNASWYVITSQNGATVTTQWGLAGDIPAPADFDSDGKADLTVYRPGGGAWFVLRSSDGTTGGLSFGLAGDVPVSSAYTLQ